MKSIAVCYICTGPYINFFPEFYKTSQLFLLKNYKKHYFVFTDNVEFFSSIKSEDITVTYINHLPWPLITLLRFNFFLNKEDELKKFDYVMFSNANMRFVDYVREEEFLPDFFEGNKKNLSVTIHPGYYLKEKKDFPVERKPISTAYIKQGDEPQYVIGAMYVATSQEFINLSKICRNNIETDLKNNVVATWHDESHLNHYVAYDSKNKYRLLPYSFCYPYPPENYKKFKNIIEAVEKESVFDIRSFKSNKTEIPSLKEKKVISVIKKIFK